MQWIANHFDATDAHLDSYEVDGDSLESALKAIDDSLEWHHKGSTHAIGYKINGEAIVVHRMSRNNMRYNR